MQMHRNFTEAKSGNRQESDPLLTVEQVSGKQAVIKDMALDSVQNPTSNPLTPNMYRNQPPMLFTSILHPHQRAISKEYTLMYAGDQGCVEVASAPVAAIAQELLDVGAAVEEVP